MLAESGLDAGRGLVEFSVSIKRRRLCPAENNTYGGTLSNGYFAKDVCEG